MPIVSVRRQTKPNLCFTPSILKKRFVFLLSQLKQYPHKDRRLLQRTNSSDTQENPPDAQIQTQCTVQSLSLRSVISRPSQFAQNASTIAADCVRSLDGVQNIIIKPEQNHNTRHQSIHNLTKNYVQRTTSIGSTAHSHINTARTERECWGGYNIMVVSHDRLS